MRGLRMICLVCAVIALVALSGCIKKEKEGEIFVGGTEGLSFSFVSPEQQVFAGEPFNIVLKVQNMGEFEIPSGSINFTLQDANKFDISENTKTNTVNLLGRKIRGEEVISEGGTTFITWENANLNPLIITEKQEVPLSIIVKYPYNTLTVVPDACTSLSGEICQPTGEKSIKNSGAPIHIKSYKQTVIKSGGGVKLKFAFIVENVGSGKVSSDSEFKLENLDSVNITNITFSGIPFDVSKACGSNTFSIGEEYWCTLENVSGETRAQLVLNTSYWYQEIASMKISVLT
ncbi:MAG: hypothetical protein ACP5KK_01340 [Candidatus Nanoarchaeia archaeon]